MDFFTSRNAAPGQLALFVENQIFVSLKTKSGHENSKVKVFLMLYNR